MSLATLAARLYTVKSRKNLSLPTAFVSLVREDLAMRFSVFNMVRAVTGSDFIATLIQSKYGKLTPIEREEANREKRKYSEDRKFKQFTLNSIVTLNNKINTLTSLTERNTALILNLYNDLGFFKGQRRDTVSQINSLSAVRVKIKSRTVKYQIDQLKAEMDALQQITVGRNISRRIKNAAAAGGGATMFGVGAGIGAAGGKPGEPGKPDAAIPESSKSSTNKLLGLLDDPFWGTLLGYGAAAGAGKLGKTILDKIKGARGAAKTATPVKPTSTATRVPVLDERLKSSGSQYRDPKTGRITNAPAATATKPPPVPSRGFGARIFGALGTAGRILGTGPQAIATIMGGAAYMASGAAGTDVVNKMQERVKPFGIKIIPTKDGILYEINGVTYTSQNLPPEYQTILDAYAIDSRSASSRAARQTIQAAPALYNSLIVEGPPLFAESDTAMSVIAAAKAAELSVPEPQMVASGIPTISTLTQQPSSASVVSTAPKIPIDFAAFAEKIGRLESSNNYASVNSLGYLGKYQFGAMALQDLGLVKKGTSLKGLDDPKKWNIEGGKQAFLNNPELQEKSFIRYTTQNYRTLKIIGVLTAESPPDQVAGFLAASHLVGAGGAKDLMKGVVTADDYGTKSSSYYAAGVSTQKTYMAAARPTSKLEYVSGATATAPPLIAAASTTSTTSASSINAEIKSEAAIQTTQTMQSAIVTLASNISDMKKQNDLDYRFPSVRNQAFTPA